MDMKPASQPLTCLSTSKEGGEPSGGGWPSGN